ncbi:hypothetical protein RDI58_012967 [Solanum bulbocastanum]|uniref:Uncharacterized protein n=1 Tax=Solanum bulbocastanum TaxID=147425 RepID=A0AAN8TIN5_SOLBU
MLFLQRKMIYTRL